VSSLLASCGALLILAALMLPSLAQAEDSASKEPEPVDTEHIFGFAEGADIGEKGESEFDHREWPRRQDRPIRRCPE